MTRFLDDLRRINIRQTTSAFGFRIASTLLSFCLLLAASRVLESEEYGIYIFLFSLGTALGIPCAVGQHLMVVKHYRQSGHEPGNTNQEILKTNVVWLARSLAALILGAVVFYALSPSLPAPYSHVYISFVFAGAFAIGEYMLNYFRVRGNLALALMPRENAWRIVSAATLVALAWSGFALGGAAAAGVVTVLLVGAVAPQVIVFLRTEGIGFLRPITLKDDMRKTWRREIKFFMASEFFAASSGYIEAIVIGALIGLEEAAFYFVAHRLAAMLLLPVVAIDTLGVPRISARFQENDRIGAQSLVSALSFVAFTVASVGYLCLFVIGEPILGLFDPAFPANIQVLYILGASAVVHAFFGPGTWLPVIGGGERFMLYCRAVLFTGHLILMAVLGTMFGLIGVAFANLATVLLTQVISAVWTRRNWRVDVTAASFLRNAAPFTRRPAYEP